MTKEAKFILKNTKYNTEYVPSGIIYWQNYLVSKCCNLFTYENLPETLPSFEIEKNLIIKGNGCVIKKNNKLYIPFTGNVFGFDAYYVPNKFTYAQPILGSGTVEDFKDGAIIWNTEWDKVDYTTSTIYNTIRRYARMLSDIESTFSSILISGRMGRLGVAQNNQTAVAVDTILSGLEEGVTKTIINPTQILDTYKPLQFTTQNAFNFTEIRDYILKCFYEEIGVEVAKDKKERLITEEITKNDDLLDNNVSCMYDMRVKNVLKINTIFGTNIKVNKKTFLETANLEGSDDE